MSPEWCYGCGDRRPWLAGRCRGCFDRWVADLKRAGDALWLAGRRDLAERYWRSAEDAHVLATQRMEADL